jgi:predicted GH43/DUF377 family glycosyl hydrolase
MPTPLLQRASNRPVLEPRADHWDSVSVFNPGAIMHDGRVWMLYRAVSDIKAYISRFGLAVSDDGFHFERVVEAPVHAPCRDYEIGGVEDARITRDGDSFLITYAAVSVIPGPAYDQVNWFERARRDPYIERPGMPPMGPSYTGLLRSRDLRSFSVEGLLTPLSIDDRDGILFPEKINGQYVMLHRPSHWIGHDYGTEQPAMWLAYSDDLIRWDYGTRDQYLLMKPQAGIAWEEQKIGGGPPPVKTKVGWLCIYHGVDNKHVYRVGAALLDLQEPRKVIGRTRHFLMEPEMEWEKVGVIPNVCFPTAAIIRGNELLVYYGAADRVVGLAIADVDALLSHLLA